MYRISLLCIAALICAIPAIAQHQRPVPVTGIELPEQAERALERSKRLLGLTIPEPARLAARGVPQVLAEANVYAADEDWDLVFRATHTYQGLLRHLTTYFEEPFIRDLEPFIRDLEPTYRIERSYDGQSRLSEVHFDWWDGSAFVPNWRIQHTYSGSAIVPTTVVSQWFDGETWINDDRETYTLAGGGTYFTAVVHEFWTGSDWAPDMRTLLTEEQGGTVYLDQLWTGDWSDYSRAIVPNLSIPQLIEAIVTVMAMEDDYIGLFLPWSYIPDHTYEYWYDGAWMPDSRQITENYYNGSVLVRAEVTIEDYLDGWEPALRLVRTYDLNEDHLLDLFELQFPEDEEWMTLLQEEYGYTPTEHLSSAEVSLVFEDGKRPGRGVEIIPLALYEYSWEDATVSAEEPVRALTLSIDAVYPSPLSSTGVVRFNVAEAGAVTLTVYDLLGRRVATLVEATLEPGSHEVRFDATRLPSGMVVIGLETAQGRAAKTAIIAR